MKKILLILLTIVLFISVGCSPAKKPETQNQPQPGTSDVAYQSVELTNAPSVIRDLAESYKGRDIATLANTSQGYFVLVTKPAGVLISDMRLVKATRNVTYDGDERLKLDIETLAKGFKASTTPSLFIARLDLTRKPDYVSFEFIKKQEVVPKTPPAAPSPAPEPGKVSTNISVYQPSQDATVTNPFTVSGLTKVTGGTVNIRLIDVSGKTLAQTSTPANDGGKFETSVSYTPPATPVKGRILVTVRGSKGLYVSFIRVTIK